MLKDERKKMIKDLFAAFRWYLIPVLIIQS